jgi:hypothetical protein
MIRGVATNPLILYLISAELVMHPAVDPSTDPALGAWRLRALGSRDEYERTWKEYGDTRTALRP